LHDEPPDDFDQDVSGGLVEGVPVPDPALEALRLVARIATAETGDTLAALWQEIVEAVGRWHRHGPPAFVEAAPSLLVEAWSGRARAIADSLHERLAADAHIERAKKQIADLYAQREALRERVEEQQARIGALERTRAEAPAPTS